MSEKQTLTAGDVGAVSPKLLIEGTGTFTPPAPGAAPAARPADPRRAELLARHKALKAELAAKAAEVRAVEAELEATDAQASLARKLAELTPAERKLLDDKLAEKLQGLLDKAGGPPA